jgi:hypothetical protein
MLNQNRRSFLGALTGAAPMAALAATAPVGAAEPHDPKAGSRCNCKKCWRDLVASQDQRLACDAGVCLYVLDAALGRLVDSRPMFDDVSADAHGLRWVVAYGAVSIWSAVIPCQRALQNGSPGMPSS